MLLDPLNDLKLSVEAGLPVYKMTGGPGYVYCASFDANGRGKRRYDAIDIARPLARLFGQQLSKILAQDQLRASTDYGLWPDVAKLTRSFALDTSVTIANKALDDTFERLRSKKLRSHVWSILPMGSANFLEEHLHSTKINFRPPDIADFHD